MRHYCTLSYDRMTLNITSHILTYLTSLPPPPPHPPPPPPQCDSKEAVEKVLQGEKPSEALGKDKKRRFDHAHTHIPPPTHIYTHTYPTYKLTHTHIHLTHTHTSHTHTSHTHTQNKQVFYYFVFVELRSLQRMTNQRELM